VKLISVFVFLLRTGIGFLDAMWDRNKNIGSSNLSVWLKKEQTIMQVIVGCLICQKIALLQD